MGTSLVTKKSLEKPIQGTTPRLGYKWFLLIYKISYFVGIFGYLTMMATFLGFNLIFNVKPSTCSTPCTTGSWPGTLQRSVQRKWRLILDIIRVRAFLRGIWRRI